MKTPFYRTIWFQFILPCIVIVSGVGIWTFAQKGQPEIVFTCMNYPIILLWEIVVKVFYHDNANPDQKLNLLPFVLLSIVLWWIFLGTVLGTILYRIFGNKNQHHPTENNKENS